MKVGIVPINVGVEDGGRIAAVARRAEELGLESLWTYEHVVVPLEYASPYPYAKSGKMPATPETAFVDPLVALAAVAGATSRIRLGTAVIILPQREPLLFAKQVASLDFISGGRLLLGLGVGWLEEEYQALGAPFAGRGARFDDYVVALRKVWSGEVVEHESAHLHWHGFKSYPLPVQRPGPPLIIGGTTPAALRRVVRVGDGWFPPNRNLEELEQGVRALHAECAVQGRDPSTLEITAMIRPERDGASLARLAELGVSRVVVPIATLGTGDPLAAVERLAELLPSLAG